MGRSLSLGCLTLTVHKMLPSRVSLLMGSLWRHPQSYGIRDHDIYLREASRRPRPAIAHNLVAAAHGRASIPNRTLLGCLNRIEDAVRVAEDERRERTLEAACIRHDRLGPASSFDRALITDRICNFGF